MGTKWISKELELKIVELSKTTSQEEIAILFNRTQSGIGVILKRNDVSKQKRNRLNINHLSLDVDYFKEINSNDKAYWLGFICADGNINKKNNKVTLTSKDFEVIEGFKESIKSEHTLSESSYFDKRTNKTYKRYSIQITNELFTQHLINLGITSDKTNILGFPKISEKYYPYFIAGLFDGDGSIILRGKNKNRIDISLISTKEILDFISNYILLNFDIKPKYLCRVTKKKSNVWKMYLYKDAHKFLEFIYFDKHFEYYLKRKYNIFSENINNRKHTHYIRKILQYDINMKLIKIWNSQREIGSIFPYSNSGINGYLKKGQKNGLYKNYIWRYEE